MKSAHEFRTPQSRSLLAQALLATCIDSSPQFCRAQEREAWTFAILSYVQRQLLKETEVPQPTRRRR